MKRNAKNNLKKRFSAEESYEKVLQKSTRKTAEISKIFEITDATEPTTSI